MLKGSFTLQTGTVDIRTTDVVLRTPQKPAPVQEEPTWAFCPTSATLRDTWWWQNQPGPMWLHLGPQPRLLVVTLWKERH